MRLAIVMLTIVPIAAFATAVNAQDEETVEEPDTAIEWQTAARNDVLAAYQIFVENHPGMYDLENPGFPAQLAEARSSGLTAAREATNRSGYRRALATFSAVLADGHALAIVPSNSISEDAVDHWPGYVALWRGDRLLVHSTETSHPLQGAQITACDGQPINDFLRSALLNRYFRTQEAGQWWLRPSQLFFAFGEPSAEQPKRCTYRLIDGSTVERPLDWTAVTPEQRLFYWDSLFGPDTPTKLDEPRPGLFLIGLQNFQPDEEERADFRRLYEQLRARRQELLDARALILDLRRNNGGSSGWSRELSEILWGEEAFNSRGSNNVRILWRTSEANARHVATTAIRMREEGRTEIADRWTTYAREMDAARERGEPMYEEPSEDSTDESEVQTQGPLPSDFTVPVYVITPGQCASACLDAIDYFTRFENTILIGAPTSADSTYMDVRLDDLPAGPGRIVVPNKVWIGRERGNGEYYEPDIMMTDLDWSTENFLDHIEADLAAR